MILIPFTVQPGTSRGPVVLVLILEKENLDRMREADPFDLQLRTLGGSIDTKRPLRDLDLVIAYEEDSKTIMDFHRRQDVNGLLAWLERGRTHLPGDAQPPVRLRET